MQLRKVVLEKGEIKGRSQKQSKYLCYIGGKVVLEKACKDF